MSAASPAPSAPQSMVRRWRLGLRWWRRHLRVPPWIVIGATAIGLGIWGFLRIDSAPGSKPVHHLDVFQSFISSVDLFGLGLGPAGSLGQRVPWQLVVAILLRGVSRCAPCSRLRGAASGAGTSVTACADTS